MKIPADRRLVISSKGYFYLKERRPSTKTPTRLTKYHFTRYNTTDEKNCYHKASETHNSGTISMDKTNRDFLIREVSEIGFSSYGIFRDIIGDEYHHVTAVYLPSPVACKIGTAIIEKHFQDGEFETKSYISYNREGDINEEVFFFSKKYKTLVSINTGKDDTNFVILSTEKTAQLEEIVKEFNALRKEKKASMLEIICFNRNFYTESFEIKIPETPDINFFDCYNEDFEDISAEIQAKLSVPNGKGIALFHGDVGTGKTTYLRRLITSIKDKKVIYMPPDLASRISSPEFVTFLMENPNSVLIIEDAENVLIARDEGGSQAVSNLLNVSDGILGDALHLQIVCTFNCSTDRIDSALMRPGRLIAEYRFNKLKPERANRLIEKLYKDEIAPVQDDISLATIFNMKETLIKTKEKERPKFGFAA